MEKTPTEIAFEKARQFDIIVGYLLEQKLCKTPIYPDETLLTRYQMRFTDPGAVILGELQYHFEVEKSKKQ